MSDYGLGECSECGVEICGADELAGVGELGPVCMDCGLFESPDGDPYAWDEDDTGYY